MAMETNPQAATRLTRVEEYLMIYYLSHVFIIGSLPNTIVRTVKLPIIKVGGIIHCLLVPFIKIFLVQHYNPLG